MKKRCPFGKCEKCIWYREFRYTDKSTGKHELKMNCGIEIILEAIPQIAGSIDGLQGGVNEARNRSIETKAIVDNRTNQFVGTLEAIRDETMKRLK